MRSALREADRIDRTIRLREITSVLSVEELPAEFEKAKKLARTKGWELLAALGSRWAELDPRGAVAFGLKNGRVDPGGGYNGFLHAVLEKWSSRAPNDAIAWVAALPPGHDRNALSSTLIATIGRNDPHAALQLLRREPSSSRSRWPTENLFSDWGFRDPQAAAAAAAELTGSLHLMALNGVARSWTQTDPQAAMGWANEIPNLGNRKAVMNTIVAQWAAADPLAVITWGRSLTDEVMRRSALTEGIARLASADLPAALAQIQALPAGDDRDQAVINAANGLARTDARAAVPLLDELAPGPQRNQALASLCEIWGESDPRGALECLFRNSTPSSQNYGLQRIASGWVGSAPEEAIAWAIALPSGDGREAALAAMIGGLVETDFARAEAIYGKLSGEPQAQAASVMTSNLVQQDMNKARQWAETLPIGKARNASLQVVGSHWAYQNPTAAAQWLNTLPPSDGRDRAISGFAETIFTSDPDGALTWALAISDEKERDKTVENLAQQWLQTDSAKAREWITAANQLSAEQKRRILER